MRSPIAPFALAALAALTLAAPALAADPPPAEPAPAAPPPAAPVPPVYSLTPPPYMVPAPYGAPYAAPPPYGVWTRPPILVEGRKSTAMRNTGIVFFALGIATTLIGIVLVSGSQVDASECQPVPVDFGVRHRARESIGVAREALDLCQAGPAPGGVTIAVGASLGVIGVPLFVVGNRAALVPAPEVRLGAGTAALRWTF